MNLYTFLSTLKIRRCTKRALEREKTENLKLREKGKDDGEAVTQ